MADPAPAIQLVLKHEGGYVNDPVDPGGETNFGISKRSYPNEDIKNMTPERATEIYQRDYWRFDAIQNQRLANCVMDSAVNQGLGAAIRMLQRAAGVQPADGKWGPQTSAACNNATLEEFQTQRHLRYVATIAANPAEYKYLANWTRRTLDC